MEHKIGQQVNDQLQPAFPAEWPNLALLGSLVTSVEHSRETFFKEKKETLFFQPNKPGLECYFNLKCTSNPPLFVVP